MQVQLHAPASAPVARARRHMRWLSLPGMQTLPVLARRFRSHCWVQGPEDSAPLLPVHGDLTTGGFWQAIASRLPARFRAAAPDLRAFGRSERLPVDARRGLRDWSEDLRSLVEALGWVDQRLFVGSAARLPDAVVYDLLEVG